MKILIKGICGGYINFDNVWAIEPINYARRLRDKDGNVVHDEYGEAVYDKDRWVVEARAVESGEMTNCHMVLFKGTEEQMNEWFKWFNGKLQGAQSSKRYVMVIETPKRLEGTYED